MCFEWAHSRLRFRCDFPSRRNCFKFHAKFTKFHLISEPGTSSRMFHIYLVMIANTKLSLDGPIRLSGYLLIEATTNMLHAPRSKLLQSAHWHVPGAMRHMHNVCLCNPPLSTIFSLCPVCLAPLSCILCPFVPFNSIEMAALHIKRVA